MATSTSANANSPANIIPVGPPPAITTACSLIFEVSHRNLIAPRFRSAHVKVLAARDNRRLIGTNVVTRWGSFGFFGPLTVLPEFWDQGVAQQLLESTMTIFDRWGMQHTGLFTFAQSAKHVGLYQKLGYWPQYLTAIMMRVADANRTPRANSSNEPVLLSNFKKREREQAIAACTKLTGKIKKGLDLSDEMRAALAQRTGDVAG
jgi:N-acetylglutamate synthase-like GNAT family acetyltransferase